MPRLEFSRKTRAQAFARCKGLCEKCGARLKVGGGEYDHILEAELGGDNTLANCQVLCAPCHREKTNTGIRVIRKSDRQRDKNSGAFKPSPRGFRKAPPQHRATSPIQKPAAWRPIT